MAREPEYQLGPLPWSEGILTDAHWRDSRNTRKWIEEHPGSELFHRAQSLEAVLRIFQSASEDFGDKLRDFHLEAEEGSIFQRNREHDLVAYEQHLQKLLYLFASSAMTLVDQSRSLNNALSIPKYQEMVAATFSSSPRHRFVQELRVDVIHVTLHKPGWELSQGVDEGFSSRFKLWAGNLKRLKHYNTEARQFVRENPEGIDLGRLVAGYTAEVLEFHEWLHAEIDRIGGASIADYQRCVRTVKAISSRSWWNLVFNQIVANRRLDPYDYLDQYLTSEELEEIRSLPPRSRQQVDRLIEMIDEYGACDADLRATIYRACNVRDS